MIVLRSFNNDSDGRVLFVLGFKLAKIRDSVFRLTVENDDLKNLVQLLLQKNSKKSCTVIA